MNTVIKVENLSKRYFLSHKNRETFPTFRDAITKTTANFGKCLLHPFKASSGQPLEGLDSTEEFWALKDVSFEVKEGDRVGIIGRNGAGKSTLLKILSRITEPTTGRIGIKGRVASLLEVGTGFHPELTGGENIFLNGAILGMSRADIKLKFDEIVAFAEVEKFLDTPVKRYSSGMYVRLAFAVAAHLEPEILIVDEVLAVGDAQFQKKCLGKMEDVGKEGRTVLFVSHNIPSIKRLCNRSIWLANGEIRMSGDCDNIVQSFITSDCNSSSTRVWPREQAPGMPMVALVAARIYTIKAAFLASVDQSEDFFIEIEYEILHDEKNLRVGFFLVNSEGVIIFAPNDTEGSMLVDSRKKGHYRSICKIPGDLLNEDLYTVTLSADIPAVKSIFYLQGALTFRVNRLGGSYGTRLDKLPGVICPALEWEIIRVVN